MIPYQYDNLPIPGGGYVTGLLFHPTQEDLLYIRTDIGGTYRFDYPSQSWKSLIKHVTMFDLSETYPIAIATSPSYPERLFIASGVNPNPVGVLSVSYDYGETFVQKSIPTLVHGNLNGRGTGLRLVVDPKDENTLYFASQTGGLLRTRNLGDSWEAISSMPEKWLTFVWVDPLSPMIVVGTAGVTTSPRAKTRGHSLYVSYDDGLHFEPLCMPKALFPKESRYPGYVGHRYSYDGTYLYVNLSQTGEYSYVQESGYSCDSGEALGGKVLRYRFTSDRRIDGYDEITPPATLIQAADAQGLVDSLASDPSVYRFGFGGIATTPARPGLLIASTICRKRGDMLFLSLDYGQTWKIILYDISIGKLQYNTSYMKPQYNGNHSIIHWMSSLAIHPGNPQEAWFNTGVGTFRTKNLLDDVVIFEDCCKGLEETVHLNLYSPPSGEVLLIDIVGDLGAFAFRSLDTPCENSFADEDGNRYITCINADYPDKMPEKVIVTPRGNWTGHTKGGLILSEDGCRTFRRLSSPYGISKFIDEHLAQVERPNVNSGWVAMSSNGLNIVWSIAEGICLPMLGVITSNDGGNTFQKTIIYNLENESIVNRNMKVFSDRISPHLMYGFGSNSDFYVSKDGGRIFHQYPVSKDFPQVEFALIDCANKTELRANYGKIGHFYMALAKEGLWEMQYDPLADHITLTKCSQEGDSFYRIGLGVSSMQGDYFDEEKALYVCASIGDDYGFFRSTDHAKTWDKISDDQQMFGDINSIEGDPREFGRYYIASGSLGVLYGIPKA